MVRDSPELPEEQRKHLEIVNRSGEHLLGLIDDVLDTAKIEAGRMTLDKQRVDLIHLVHDTLDMMRPRAADKGLELILESSPAVPQFIRSDAGKLRQMLTNLLGNAIKFTERGNVTVRLDVKSMDVTPINGSQGTVLVLEVEDTGIGIAPDDQARIFDVFVQAGNTATQKGTGLGLSITQQFAQLMGGTIRVQSALGKGSLFRVQLPVEQVEESDPTSNHYHRQVDCLAPGQPDFRILVVEDKKENWLLLQRLLLDTGFQVQVANNGLQGIEIFRTWRPHLIWMDVRLPVMGGVEATGKIRLLEGGRRVKIVALSASAFAHERQDVLAAGLDDFLRKPYRREEIFDCIARHLGVRYLYRESQSDRPGEPIPAVPPNLAMLPEELRKELLDAVVHLDSGRIEGVIRRVLELDPQAGEFLAHAAKQLAYSKILKALSGTQSSGRVSV
jgi:CheY-like chemotaxis protein